MNFLLTTYAYPLERPLTLSKNLKIQLDMWIVARYDDKGEANRLRKYHKRMRAKGHLSVSVLEDEHPRVKGETMVCDYSYLLSLLINTEGNSYYGRGFIIANPEPTKVQDESMWFQRLMLTNQSVSNFD